jgi:nucleoside-diphosphate-sugar epimerase
VYVKELVRFIQWNVETRDSASEVYNCTFEPAYTIETIVNTMKRVTGLTQFVPYVPNAIIMPAAVVAKCLGSPMGICPARVKKLQVSTNICGKKMAASGYQFKWTFEGAISDWFKDNNCKFLK